MQCTYNVTLRHGGKTYVAVEKQQVRNIKIVCLYSCISATLHGLSLPHFSTLPHKWHN